MTAPRAADFGPLVVETDVDAAVISTLRLWLPTELSALEDQRDMSRRLLRRPVPESYTNTFDDDDFPDPRLPAIVVTTAQTTGDPQMDGNGNYFAAWRVVVSAVVRGATPAEVRVVAALFGGAIRRTLVHQPDLGGFAGATRWAGSDPIRRVNTSSGDNRHLAAARNTFTVFVDHVMQAGGGPYVPEPGDPYPYDPPDPGTDSDTPYDSLVTVGAVTTSVTAKPPTQED